MGARASSIVIHPTAVVDDSAEIGPGTVVWAHACILAGARIGSACRIGHAAFVDRGVRVGDRCVLHNKASVYRPVELGNDVFVGPHVVFANDPDPRAGATRDLGGVRWIVGDGATVGANCTILSDVNLAEHCFIGAGAVVTRDTVPYGLYVGTPARLVGHRCRCGARYSGPLPKECERCRRTF